jgi:hypothetical protein
MRKTAILLLTFLISTAAYADHYGDTYVIPVVGHVRGANGVTWMSDVAIRNFSATPMTVELILIESGGNLSDNIVPLVTDELDGSVTIPANRTVMLEDILGGYEVPNITGALLLGSDRPFAVTSRAYNDQLPLGQTVPASRNFFENSLGTIDNTTAVYIPGIISNGDTRTNIGFVAGSAGSLSTPMLVEVTIRDANGGVAGTHTVFIPQGNFAQYQFNIDSFVDEDIDTGTAEFRITQGEGTVVPYASLIDNQTGEAAYIMGEFPDSTPQANGLRRTSLFRQLLEKKSTR